MRLPTGDYQRIDWKTSHGMTTRVAAHFERMCALLVILGMASGCTHLRMPASSPLVPAQMSSDSVALDIIFAHVPPSDDVLNQIWTELDEQFLPQETRKGLYQNGFRIGRCAGPVPQSLAEVMKLTDSGPAYSEVNTADAMTLTDDDTPTRRHLQLRTGCRTEILASAVYEELPFLRREDGRLVGRTLPKAQGVFALTTRPGTYGGTRIRLVPEVHFGEPRIQPIAKQGMIRWESQRERVVLDDLIVETELQPGDLLVLTCLPNCPGSLGNRFFTVTSQGKMHQKIIIIRLSQTQASSLFTANE
ncbi:MAG TPA: hypothetical protein PLS55_12605 [Thermogutta sp.]|nr:hypothetical protein [Thermogutta sp.]